MHYHALLRAGLHPAAPLLAACAGNLLAAGVALAEEAVPGVDAAALAENPDAWISQVPGRSSPC
jgi:hypothetical protein